MTRAKRRRPNRSANPNRTRPRTATTNGKEVPATGTLEVLPDGYGFLRQKEESFTSSVDDVYVSRSLIDRFDLVTGSEIDGVSDGSRLKEVVNVNGLTPDEFRHRPSFGKLTPQQPRKRLSIEVRDDMSLRVLDLVTPIGKGQRGLVVSPPRAGKTVLLQKMAKAILENHPECHVIILLVDERPEEVTDVREMVAGQHCEVISSTFDQAPSNHVRIAKLVLERAKRLVECGRDVVLFLDSITRLTRAHNSVAPAGCKLTTGGLAMEALVGPKEFFGAARQLRESGSLTILATALVDTGTRMDGFIFEEFKGTGNMEVHLSRQLVERQVWPAIDISASGTRREELLLDADEMQRVRLLRKALSRTDPADAMELLINRLGRAGSNAEFLFSISLDS
ncbi:MAG TPA: transcription termination factor Rho [Pirellulaceae bacterium]|nr:transcription termination factor Rho [Pirellulaceae bacterium]